MSESLDRILKPQFREGGRGKENIDPNAADSKPRSLVRPVHEPEVWDRLKHERQSILKDPSKEPVLDAILQAGKTQNAKTETASKSLRQVAMERLLKLGDETLSTLIGRLEIEEAADTESGPRPLNPGEAPVDRLRAEIVARVTTQHPNSLEAAKLL